MWGQPSCLHSRQKGERLVPILGLHAGADVEVLGDDNWEQMSLLHYPQQDECLVSLVTLRTGIYGGCVGHNIWQPIGHPHHRGEVKRMLPVLTRITKSQLL